MPYRQNFPIPAEIDPPTFCLCLRIPDDPTWKAVVAGLLAELQFWFNWERTGDDSGAQCAAVWKRLYNEIDWSSMSCCCDQITLYIWTEDGELEVSTDGGVTYEPAPEQDPRNNSPVYPPTAGDASDDKNCVAATGMSLLIKEGVGDQLTEGMGRYTLGQLISDWVGTVIQTSNPFEALIRIVANQIFALLVSAVIAALTEEVYHLLMCVFYCRMEDDLSYTDGDWELVRADILDQISGIAGIFLEHIVFLLGRIGLTNLARSQAATEGDCSDCFCEDNCRELYDVYGTYGTLIDSDATSITVAATLDGPNLGGYGAGIKALNPDQCCYISYELISGTITNFNGYWSPCGTDCTWPSLPNSGLHDAGCDCMHTRISTVPFTIKYIFSPCE